MVGRSLLKCLTINWPLIRSKRRFWAILDECLIGGMIQINVEQRSISGVMRSINCYSAKTGKRFKVHAKLKNIVLIEFVGFDYRSS